MNSIKSKFRGFLVSLHEKLFKINDTPQKVAVGFGLGVASGILPGTGPLISLFLAWLFRVNRAASLIGCLLTNTWISFVTFVLAIKLGSVILKVRWEQVLRDWEVFLREFHWRSLLQFSALKIALPVITGYLIIACAAGLLAYLGAFFVIMKYRQKQKGGSHES